MLGSVEVSATPKEKFREFLATKKMRLTPEREIIIEEVFSDHEHFDAEEMVNRLSRRKDSKRVSRSTVYRTLSQLEEAGLLRRVARNNDREIYEHDYGYPQHEHLVCERCGKMIEFQSGTLEAALREVCGQHQFQMNGHTLVVRGTCADCNRARTAKRRLDLI